MLRNNGQAISQKTRYLRGWRDGGGSPPNTPKEAIKTYSRFLPLKRLQSREFRAVQKSRFLHGKSARTKSTGYAVQKSGAKMTALRPFETPPVGYQAFDLNH